MESVQNTMKMFGHDTMKLDRFDGTNFLRWKEKMKFLLTVLKVFYVLDPNLGNIPEPSDEDTDGIITERMKRIEDEMLCRGYILNSLSDRLYDLYTPIQSTKDMWNSLKYKYDAEKKKLLHTSEEFTLDQIQKHLRIEEETRIRENELNVGSSSKEHYISQSNKGKKRKANNNASDNPKQYKNGKRDMSEIICHNCGNKGHIKRFCRFPKKEQNCRYPNLYPPKQTL
ncbi:hypothetical protein RND81_07G183900 [Saponaria officinalis]|uniref:CCHC-type domain-containing protein n=1 Tax=Saponaria officinalis TaxID=3572 RepID=A0AAW1JT75_SAPOF